MFSLLNMIKINKKLGKSYSVLVDFQQLYVKNIFLFCSGLGMVRILFGENIICHTDVKSLSQSFVDTKCFINGTISQDDKVPLNHNYYQFVSLFLLLIAIVFQLPFLLWIKMFGAYIRELEQLSDKPDEAIQLIKESKGNNLFYKIWLLEIIYFTCTILILIYTNIFFNDTWNLYGWSWKTIYKIFPDNGTCYVTYFYVSDWKVGQFNCLLPISSVYRKSFGVLYILYCLLLTFNTLMLLYRFLLICIKKKNVNIWWAVCIAKQSTLLWRSQMKYDQFLREQTFKLNIV